MPCNGWSCSGGLCSRGSGDLPLGTVGDPSAYGYSWGTRLPSQMVGRLSVCPWGPSAAPVQPWGPQCSGPCELLRPVPQLLQERQVTRNTCSCASSEGGSRPGDTHSLETQTQSPGQGHSRVIPRPPPRWPVAHPDRAPFMGITTAASLRPSLAQDAPGRKELPAPATHCTARCLLGLGQGWQWASEPAGVGAGGGWERLEAAGGRGWLTG